MAELEANGLTFHVVRMQPADDVPPPPGGWPTVVLLHGLIMDNLSSLYYTMAPAIAAHADVVLYDLRGHGRTQRPPAGYTLGDAVDDLVAVLDELGVAQPAYLVGNSFGGTVAMAAAMWRPERVAGIVLVEGHPVVAGWGDEVVDRLEGLVGGFDDPGVREWIEEAGGRKLRRMAAVCEELVTATSMPEDLRRERPWTDDDLATVACPVLCLYGEHSDILDRAERLHAAFGDSELAVLEGCSHSVLMEAPDELHARIVAWLAERTALVGAGVAAP